MRGWQASGLTRGRQGWRVFIDTLFPPRCGGCGAGGSLWCDDCRHATSLIQLPVCDKCGQPDTSGLCGNCRARPLRIEYIRSAVLFDGRARDAIHRFKYERWSSLAEPLGEWLVAVWQAVQPPADWIVPVPLHAARERERGYNQSALLARQLGRQVRVPVVEQALRRVRATKVQMQLNAAERQANMAGAFAAVDARLRGRRVVVIDDVCTTGATLDACAAALLDAGAAAVYGLTLARTP